MAQRTDRTELQLERERCFLVGAIVPGRYEPHEDPLEELAALVDTAGGQVVGRLTQRLDHPHGRTYLGKGRFEEMAETVKEFEADTVVVDDDISPAQLGAIEDACRRKVIDRSEVILDIFASRARSHQARLQVELAQMEYELPRLARKWTHLERLGGGIGTRGPGETQIETDRRILRRKIASLRQELDQIEKRKEREVSARSDLFTACLVGYTNAGKSSLMNRLTGAGAKVQDRLFATLDTLTRRMEAEDGTALLLSDTVGFIRRLPHHLVASFHATLEEAAQADLLLQVVDASDPGAGAHLRSVEGTLRELGLADHDRLFVFNKCDAVDDRAGLRGLSASVDPSVTVSARTEEGLEALRTDLFARAAATYREHVLRFSVADGKRFALVNELGQVRDTRYEDAEVVMRARLTPEALAQIRRLPGAMGLD